MLERKASSPSRCFSRLGVSSGVATMRPAVAPGVAVSAPKSDLRKHQPALALKVKARQDWLSVQAALQPSSVTPLIVCRSKPE